MNVGDRVKVVETSQFAGRTGVITDIFEGMSYGIRVLTEVGPILFTEKDLEVIT